MSNIIEKIKKLLNLSKDGCNRHVAEMAAEKAQQLIQENNISEELLSDQTDARESPEWVGFVYENGVCHVWAVNLATELAKNNNGCVGIWSGRGVKFCGAKKDFDLVKYLFDWICSQMQTLADKDVAGQGVKARNSYKQGMVATIAKRLNEAREKAKASAKLDAMLNELDEPTNALVLVEDAIGRLDIYRESAIEKSKKILTGSWRGGSRGISDLSSFERGVLAGDQVRLEGGETKKLT